MADNSTRPAARLAAALAVLVALVAAPLDTTAAAPTPPPDALAEWAERADDRFFYWAQQAAPDLTHALQHLDHGGRFIFNLAWGDLTGDGLDDVMVTDVDFGPGGLGLTGVSTKLGALDGRDGSSLWTREFESDVVFPIEVTLGKKPRAGALVVSYDYEDDTTTFLGLDHRGRRAYRHSFRASSTVDGGEITGREDIASFDVQNSLPGRATDVVVGIADVRRTPEVDPSVPAVAGVTRTVAIDGRSGDLVEHAEGEIGVGRVPVPLAGPDLDGDGLDDHVMAYVLPGIESDEESGLPASPSTDLEREFLRGRRGVDGRRLWTSPPMEIDDGWDAPPLFVDASLGDQTRDGHEEPLLNYSRTAYVSPDYRLFFPPTDAKGAWSLSGRNGRVLWHRPVVSGVTLDDLDRDKRRDVLLVDDVSHDKRFGTRLTAASGLDARRVYSRFFPVRRRSDDQTVDSDLWRAGDLQPDGVDDFVLDQGLRRDFDNGTEWYWVRDTLLSGATGTRIRRLASLFPLRASVDGHGDDLVRWNSPSGMTVVDGRTRRELLTVELDIPLTLPTDVDYLVPMAARVDRDRCADFFGTLANSGSTFAVAVDGGSGRLLWAKRQQGVDVGGPVTQTKRIDRNRAC